MAFRFEGGLVNFDGSVPNGAPGMHWHQVVAPAGEKLLWAYVLGYGPGAPKVASPPLMPTSYSLDSTGQITKVDFFLPDTTGERAVLKMFYTV